MNFLSHVDIEWYITLGRTRGLNVSYKLVVQMHRRGNQRCKYRSVLSANSNNNFCELRDILRRALGTHKMGQGAACSPRAARWAALFLLYLSLLIASQKLTPFHSFKSKSISETFFSSSFQYTRNQTFNQYHNSQMYAYQVCKLQVIHIHKNNNWKD